MTVIQESSNSVVVNGTINSAVEATLNIQGLQIISILISADQSLDGNSYDIYVSNNNLTWHYFGSVQMTGNLVTNCFSPTLSGVFGSVCSFNHLRINLPAILGLTGQVIISGR